MNSDKILENKKLENKIELKQITNLEDIEKLEKLKSAFQKNLKR